MTFDYAASAELFLPKGKPGARRTTSYRRFRTLGAWMQVGDERFDGDDIRRLYDSTSHPRRRRARKSVDR